MPSPQIAGELKLASIRDELVGHEAELFLGHDDSGVSILGDREIRRGWVFANPDHLSQYEDYLDRFTDAKNTDESRTVVDPEAGKEVFKGLYRQAFILRTTRRNPENPRDIEYILIQVLRKGYIESIHQEDANGDDFYDWSEARLMQSKSYMYNDYDTGSERYFELHWKNVSPFHRFAITDQIHNFDADGFSPDLFGETLPINCHRLFVTSRLENDGSATIILFLAHPEYTLYGYQMQVTERQTGVRYFFNVPKELSQGILDAHKAKGVTALASHSQNEGLVNIVVYAREYIATVELDEHTFINCDADEWTHFYWGVEDPSLYALPTTTTNGWTYRRNVSNLKDGSFDITVVGRLVKMRTYNFDFIRTNTLLNAYEYQLKGVIDADAYDPDISSPAQGQQYTKNRIVRDDCSQDITVRSFNSVPDDFPFISRQSLLHRTDSHHYTKQATVLTAPTGSVGIIYDVQNTENDDGTYEQRYAATTAAAVTASFDSSRSGLFQRDSIRYKNRATVLGADTHVQGSIYDVQNEVNEDGSFDALWRRTNSVPVSLDIGKVRSVLRWHNQIIYKNWPDPIDPPFIDGTIYQAVNTILPDGTYDGVLVYQSDISVEEFNGKKWVWITYGPGRPDQGFIYKEIYHYNTNSYHSVGDFLRGADGPFSTGAPNLPGSRVNYVGKGRWFAVRIRQVDNDGGGAPVVTV